MQCRTFLIIQEWEINKLINGGYFSFLCEDYGKYHNSYESSAKTKEK